MKGQHVLATTKVIVTRKLPIDSSKSSIPNTSENPFLSTVPLSQQGICQGLQHQPLTPPSSPSSSGNETRKFSSHAVTDVNDPFLPPATFIPGPPLRRDNGNQKIRRQQFHSHRSWNTTQRGDNKYANRSLGHGNSWTVRQDRGKPRAPPTTAKTMDLNQIDKSPLSTIKFNNADEGIWSSLKIPLLTGAILTAFTIGFTLGRRW